MTIAANIKQYLKNKGITQTYIAHKINKSIKVLSDMLNGKVRLPAEIARDIAVVLELPPGFFLEINSEIIGNIPI